MKIAHSLRPSFWKREHHLDRMTLKELVVAYVQYPAIIAYVLAAGIAIAVFARNPAPLAPTLIAVAAAALVYPLVWYVLHRWVLHSRWMWKLPPLASTWKRIHYDHHQDPNHLEVLFGALHTTLPTIAAATLPIGWAIGAAWGARYGLPGAMAAFATGLLTTCFYEFCHCIQHLAYKPRRKWLVEMKRRHMAHHFHDETGNFGITSFLWDKLFGTFYDKASDRPVKSPTVFNLGYTPEVAEKYPHVARLSGGVATGHPRQRGRE
ncbi:MAG TPA: sterol desaturase family protein [Allosphingosinicella sp.]|jgi:sterol desaturase/sphingolipid hydroxylase (fatty acid hydroxylase superfamily)